MSKYYSKKVIVDNIKFDSKKEAKKYTELKLLLKAEIIKDLELQKKFELQPKYKINGKNIRAINYIADFVYWDINKNKIIVEDTKGYRTEVYKIKKKIFEYKYQIEIEEI